MKLLSTCLFSFFSVFAATHSLVIGFTNTLDVKSTLSGTNVLDVRQVGNNPVYKVTIDSALSSSQLIQQLDTLSQVEWVELNAPADLASREDVASIDARVIFILDDIDARVIFILDSNQMEFGPLYNQPYVEATRANLAWPHTKGRGVKVAVLDTGVDTTHPFLANNLLPGFDFVDFDADPNEERSSIDTNENGKLDEGYGHGTHVAGILKTLAPEVSIMPIRIADSDGQADLFNLVQGIAFAIFNGADVINLSLSVTEPSQLLIDWINFARYAGVVVVASAGNNNNTQLGYPAGYEKEVLAVAALDANLKKADFSNYSRKVDVCAPGDYIINAHPGGTYVARSGTSMAAPMVSAEAAIILSLVPNASVDYVHNRIRNNCDSVDALNPAYANKLGKGLIDIWDAITLHSY